MATWIKATWIKTAPGGGVSLVCFRAFKESRELGPNNRVKKLRSLHPKDISILVARSDKTLHEETGTMLLAGEFMVQDIEYNRASLARGISRNLYELDDWDLQAKLSGVAIEEQRVVEGELIEDIMIDVADIPIPKPVKKVKEKKDVSTKVQSLKAIEDGMKKNADQFAEDIAKET